MTLESDPESALVHEVKFTIFWISAVSDKFKHSKYEHQIVIEGLNHRDESCYFILSDLPGAKGTPTMLEVSGLTLGGHVELEQNKNEEQKSLNMQGNEERKEMRSKKYM